MTFTYEYPHPAVTTDIVVFTVVDRTLKVLLIERGEEPFKGRWALPGGFIQMSEDLNQSALRELYEETGVTDIYLEQLATYGSVDRDPRERVISIAYFSLIPSEDVKLQAGTDAKKAEWCDVKNLPPLAFDHLDIIKDALTRLSAKMEYSTIGLQFMPDEFTLSELQDIYQVASSKELDKRNFRKWILGLDVVEETGNLSKGGAYRPAKLYRLKAKGEVNIVK